MVNSRSRAGAIGLLTLPALLAAPLDTVLAQSTVSLAVEEIIVTARQREERLIDVPLAITAFDSETLARAGVRDLNDLAFLTPGMSLFQFGSEYFNSPVIRGLSQTQLLRNSEANVATFLDGVYVVNTGAVNFSLMDFERIEVVKGPVSALYGRNAFAGAINYVSKVPTDEFEGKAEAIVGDHARYRVAGSIGGGLVENKLAMRAAISYDHFGGTYRDTVNDERIGDHEKVDGQVILRMTPNDTLTIDASGYYGYNKAGHQPRVPLDLNCASLGGVLRVYCGEIPDAGDLPAPQAPSEYPDELASADRDVYHGRLRFEFELDAARVELLTGYFNVNNRSFVEFNSRRDGLSYNLIPGPGQANMNIFQGNDFNSEDISQEIRVSSYDEKSIRWMFGGFYFDSDQVTTSIFGSNQSQLPDGQTVGSLPGFWLTPDGGISDTKGVTDSTTRQLSAFASIDADITDATTATAELRYTDEKKTQNIISSASRRPDPDGDGSDVSFDYWDTRLSVMHEISESSRLYISAAHGTKAGGFNSAATIASDLSYGPEKNWTYEIGTKNNFGNVSLNAAVFYVDWQGVQQSALPDDPNNPANVTKNFGDAESYGIELETAFSVAEGVTGTLGGAYSRPRFKDNAFDLTAFARFCPLIPECASRATTLEGRSAARLGGTPLPRTSNWQASASLDTVQPLTGDWNWTARTDLSYQSKQYQRNLALNFVTSRVNLNLRAGIENEKYSLTAWVNNVTDDRTPYSTSSLIRLDTFVSEEVANLPERRTFGITARASF